jgi:hypothetical protein
MGGEIAFFPATIECPDGSSRRVLLSHERPERAFRQIEVECDPFTGLPLRFAAKPALE